VKAKPKVKQNLPRVYVDANIIVELAKQHFNAHDKSRENDLWFFEQMLQASAQKEIRLFTSSLTIAECTHVDGKHDAEVQRFYKGILTSGTMIELVQDSIFVAEKGRDLRWERGIALSGADLIHAASAIDSGCREMITWDGKVQGSKWAAAVPSLLTLGVAVIVPEETGVLPKRFRQGILGLKVDRKKKKKTTEQRTKPKEARAQTHTLQGRQRREPVKEESEKVAIAPETLKAADKGSLSGNGS
jgi:predicted nucleic acid-binding protein